MTIRRRIAIVLLTVALLLSCTACARPAPHYFSYLDAPCEMALSGKVGNVPFTAHLASRGRAAIAGEVPLDCDFTLTYLSPASLAGVRVEYAAASGEITVSLGALTAKSTSTAQGGAYSSLAAPALLLLTESAVQSTTGQADGSVLLTTADGARRLLSKDGSPLSLSYVAHAHRIELTVEQITER